MPHTRIDSAKPADDQTTEADTTVLDPERLDCYQIAIAFQILASHLLPVTQRWLDRCAGLRQQSLQFLASRGWGW